MELYRKCRRRRKLNGSLKSELHVLKQERPRMLLRRLRESVTGQARDMPIVFLPVGWQVSRGSASPANSVLNLIRSSSSYVLVIEPVCRLAVVDYISSCLHLHLRLDSRP
jgi:hypothetical protein